MQNSWSIQPYNNNKLLSRKKQKQNFTVFKSRTQNRCESDFNSALVCYGLVDCFVMYDSGLY